MAMTPPPIDADLLAAYRDGRSADAFAALVGRHAGWVHAAARRRVGGDEHLAHDVAQAVFVLLAERPDQVRDPARLGGWLLRTTEFAARHAVRGEARRRRRERAVAAGRPEAAPVADDDALARLAAVESAVESAVGRLAEADRTLVVARFYRGRSLAEVGADLGISADAARKRLDRALGRLRDRLATAGHPAASAAPLLAGLFAMNGPATKITYPPGVPNRSAAGPRTASIVKGVNRMNRITRWNRIVLASAASLVLAASAAGVLLASGGSPTTGPTVPNVDVATPPAAAASRTVSTLTYSIVVSQDHQTLSAVSKLGDTIAKVKVGRSRATGNVFDPFTIDNVIAGDDVAVYHDRTKVLAYSTATSSWADASEAVPRQSGVTDTSIETPVIAGHVAAFAVPGAIYAYSGGTGRWERLAIGAERSPDWHVEPNSVMATDAQGKIHYFQPRVGLWTEGL